MKNKLIEKYYLCSVCYHKYDYKTIKFHDFCEHYFKLKFKYIVIDKELYNMLYKK